MPHYTPKFHIGDPGPRDLYEYLDTVEARRPGSNEELLDAAADLGHNLGTYEKTTAGSVLGRLGVVKPEAQFEYTEMGDSLVDIMYEDRNLFDNLLHFLYYTAYERQPEEYIFSSYTYREFTNYLYDNSPFDTLDGKKGTIVSEITEKAQTDDLDLSYTKSGVSLSTKSLNNYLQFIRDLEPPVNGNSPDETPGFDPRGFCPPELLIVAVAHEYERNNVEPNSLLRANDEIKHRLKQVCLVSEEGFSEVLDYADQAYSFFSRTHDFGLNFRLEKEVGFNDLR